MKKTKNIIYKKHNVKEKNIYEEKNQIPYGKLMPKAGILASRPPNLWVLY